MTSVRPTSLAAPVDAAIGAAYEAVILLAWLVVCLLIHAITVTVVVVRDGSAGRRAGGWFAGTATAAGVLLAWGTVLWLLRGLIGNDAGPVTLQVLILSMLAGPVAADMTARRVARRVMGKAAPPAGVAYRVKD